MHKVLITTVPFAEKNKLPINLLESNGIQFLVNPFNKKLTEDELCSLISDFDVVIAGTEPITEKVMKNAKKLKLISRVGIGLDSVDLSAAEKRGIIVSYTPDAPAPAVAELTIGLMISLLRSIHVSNSQMHDGNWHRFFGRRLQKITVGIVGVGRIGKGVLRKLISLGVEKILVNDIKNIDEDFLNDNIEWTKKDRVYQEADLISIHLPLTHETYNMIQKAELLSMKEDAMIINTSRGGIVNEDDLYEVMNSGHLSGAAIDVFDFEPYNGPLKEIERCILTSHMGSMSVDCRSQMEIEATKETIRFLTGSTMESLVPEEEYEVQRGRK